MDDLAERREAVRGAGSVGDDVLAGVRLVVDAVDEHRGRVLRGGRHDDLLGAGRDVGARLLVREEQTRGLDDDLGADVTPLEGGRILLSREADRLAVDDEVRSVDLDVMRKDAVHGIVLQHVREVIGIEEVVDADHFDVVREVLDRRAENHAADTAEAVYANLNSHFSLLLVIPSKYLPRRKIGVYDIRTPPCRQGGIGNDFFCASRRPAACRAICYTTSHGDD